MLAFEISESIEFSEEALVVSSSSPILAASTIIKGWRCVQSPGSPYSECEYIYEIQEDN